jgi:hypothetical protein
MRRLKTRLKRSARAAATGLVLKMNCPNRLKNFLAFAIAVVGAAIRRY